MHFNWSKRFGPHGDASQQYDVSLGSTSPLCDPQTLRGVRLAFRPNYFPPLVMSPTCTTRTTLQISTRCSAATSSETEDVVTTLPAESLFLSSEVGSNPERHTEQNRLLTAEMSNFPEGETRMAREVRDYCRRQGFEACHHHQEGTFLKRSLLVIDGTPKEFYKARQQELPRRRFPKSTLFFT